MSDYPSPQQVGSYDAQVRRSPEEPLNSAAFENGIPVRVSHHGGRIMELTVYGTSLSDEPVYELSLESGNAPFLDDDALLAITHAVGVCTMELIRFREDWYSEEVS